MRTILNLVVIFSALSLSQIAIAQYTESDWEDRDSWMDVNDIFDKAQIEKRKLCSRYRMPRRVFEYSFSKKK